MKKEIKIYRELLDIAADLHNKLGELGVHIEEPTEPCEWCSGKDWYEIGDNLIVKFNPETRKFEFCWVPLMNEILTVIVPCSLCPNCGRRLKNDNK